ncbi:hypothetical protein SAMN03097699_2848 [Flavobacteriaceae bacterium MAR_2010_188]|nr:hypothetical protein SAMN03097699_2848 [Flavobacteriaceae bacterium MAR_2010_188]
MYKLKLLLFFLLHTAFLIGQNSVDSTNVFQKFLEYTELPREVAFAHLNKSIHIDGETLAFAVYVFDKDQKRLTINTKNVYCAISDENERIIKEKLILITDGVGSGSFFVDETLDAGNYTFKAYTNYMKNFAEQNYYIQNFRVLTSNLDLDPTLDKGLDAQFLPEGGHLLEGVQNTVGIIIKDKTGQGVANIKGEIINSKGNLVRSFKTDQFGIGSILFIPEESEKYRAKIVYNTNTLTFNIAAAERTGIAMSVLDLRSRTALDFKTNDETFNLIKNKQYTLTFHNGKWLKSFNLTFDENERVTKFIKVEDLFTGINVFTLFDEENRPILERLYFNYEGIELLKSERTTAKTIEDSIEIELKINTKDSINFQNFSVSVLPKKTVSYLPSHNIFSYLYLQPYITGYLENAAYYFTDINLQKKRQLDNLLITQGWSSYNWDFIFKNTPKYIHEFEDGIKIKANISGEPAPAYAISSGFGMNLIDLEENAKSFSAKGFYPYEKESLFVSEISKRGNTNKPALYVQFSPSRIPEFENYIKMLPRKKENILKDATYQPILETSWTGYEQLDEVVLNVKRKQDYIEKLKQITTGSVDVFNDPNRYRFNDFDSYLRSKGYLVNNENGAYQIIDPSRSIVRDQSPVILLDGVQLFDNSFLSQLNMSILDYVIIQKQAGNQVTYAPGGLIQIFTDPTKNMNQSSNSKALELNIPLAFSEDKKFYAPLYSFYQTRFFKDYGVIDWQPKLKLGKDGTVKFKFADKYYESLQICIEGTANGAFISEIVEVDVQR